MGLYLIRQPGVERHADEALTAPEIAIRRGRCLPPHPPPPVLMCGHAVGRLTLFSSAEFDP